MNKIYDYVKEKEEAILSDIEKVVKKESPTKRKDLSDVCKKELESLFKEYLNKKASVIDDDKFGDHLRYTIGEGDSQILIIGHYDTVWNEGDLDYKLEGDKAYGPGILDMKGGLIIALWALKTLKELKLNLNNQIVFLLNSDHEGVASPHSRKIIEEEAKKSKAVLVPEASVDYTNALKIERKGILRYVISAEGKAAHSGNNHEEGVNAILELSNQIKYLSSLTDYTVGTTINVGKIEGGQGINVVPDYAECSVDVRVVNNTEAEKIKDVIESITPVNTQAKLNIEGGIVRPAMVKTQESESLLNLAKEIGNEIDYEVQGASVGGGSDGSFAAALGIPTLDGLGAAGVGPHSKEEHILISHLPKRVALFANLLCQIDEKI